MDTECNDVNGDRTMTKNTKMNCYETALMDSHGLVKTNRLRQKLFFFVQNKQYKLTQVVWFFFTVRNWNSVNPIPIDESCGEFVI